MLLILCWILMTLGVSSFSLVLGKKYGVEYPIGILAALIVTAAILANKVVAIGSFSVPAGVITASTTFLITDILAEKWGHKEAQRAVWVGFFGLLLLVLSLWIGVQWSAPGFASEQAALFAQVLGLTPRIALASIVAYFVSQFHDVWAFLFWKKVTNGKHLWLRNNASTIVSQFIDSIIFITIAFYGVFPVTNMIFEMWIVKTVIALLDTPFCYAACWLVDKVSPEVPTSLITYDESIYFRGEANSSFKADKDIFNCLTS